MDFLSSQGFVSAPQLDHLIILFLYKFSAWPGWLSSHVWSWLLGVWPSWGLIALAGAHRIWEPQCDRNWTMQSVYFFVQMFMMGTWRGVGFLFACMLFEQFKHAWFAFTIERSKAGAGMHRCYCCSWSFFGWAAPANSSFQSFSVAMVSRKDLLRTLSIVHVFSSCGWTHHAWLLVW